VSRIGKHPVAVPGGVEVAIAGQTLTVKGARGELSHTFADEVEVAREDDRIWVKPRTEDRRARSMWGLSRSLVNNMVQGVSAGFTRTLEITGVGFRAAVDGSYLNLQLGYSHEIKLAVPPDVEIACPRPTAITITGADKQRVGQIAAEIRALRKPEPYKGKGIRYDGEHVRRKEGKKK
jgi:large subunit ribosomal protein L6